MKKHLSVVSATADTEDPKPACPCTTEPCIVTSSNDPCSVNVSVDDEDGVVFLTFNFHEGRTVEITLDHHRAEYVGDLMKKATGMVEQRQYADAAAFAATLCPVHDYRMETERCRCDGTADTPTA